MCGRQGHLQNELDNQLQINRPQSNETKTTPFSLVPLGFAGGSLAIDSD
jgi:hypothetical protein